LLNKERTRQPPILGYTETMQQHDLAALLPVSKAARLVSMHPRTAWSIIRKGAVKVYGSPGHYRINPLELLNATTAVSRYLRIRQDLNRTFPVKHGVIGCVSTVSQPLSDTPAPGSQSLTASPLTVGVTD